jgi:hypothetical protein
MNVPRWLWQLRYDAEALWVGLTGRLPHATVTKGDRFVAMRSIPARGLVHFRTPFTGGFQCVIPAGVVLVAFSDAPQASTAFGCIPVDVEELEHLVPSQDRAAPQYDGYSFVLPYRYIGRALKRC